MTPKRRETVPTRKGFSRVAEDGCVALLRTLKDVPEDDRLDAVAMFVDVACKTKWMTEEPHG